MIYILQFHYGGHSGDCYPWRSAQCVGQEQSGEVVENLPGVHEEVLRTLSLRFCGTALGWAMEAGAQHHYLPMTQPVVPYLAKVPIEMALLDAAMCDSVDVSDPQG